MRDYAASAKLFTFDQFFTVSVGEWMRDQFAAPSGAALLSLGEARPESCRSRPRSHSSY